MLVLAKEKEIRGSKIRDLFFHHSCQLYQLQTVDIPAHPACPPEPSAKSGSSEKPGNTRYAKERKDHKASDHSLYCSVLEAAQRGYWQNPSIKNFAFIRSFRGSKSTFICPAQLPSAKTLRRTLKNSAKQFSLFRFCNFSFFMD